MLLAFLPAALQHKPHLAVSGLHDVKVRVVPKLKKAECIVLAILSNCRSVVVTPLNVSRMQTPSMAAKMAVIKGRAMSVLLLLPRRHLVMRLKGD
jgi:hypothetical protein